MSDSRHQQLQVSRALIHDHANRLYDSLDENERACVAFGMLPRNKTEAAESELCAVLDDWRRSDVCRELAVAVMDVCNRRGPGMRV